MSATLPEIPQTAPTSSWEGTSTLQTSTSSSLSSRIIIDPTLTTTGANLINNQTQKSIKELFYNGTGYYIEDEVDPGLNDFQTLLLACFATLIPLVISLLTAFGIRILWTKYKKQKEEPKYDGILDRTDTQESISRPLHSHLLNSDKKCETHLEVEVLGSSTGLDQIRPTNHSNTNGSIITMTLKNNHLIVETEERNDIEEDSRETTMKYSPGARDGVFVVEVQQGVRRSPGSSGGGAPSSGTDSVRSEHQCALVHNPPPEKYVNVDVDEAKKEDISDNLARQIRTGLAQSDTSLTGRPSYGYYTNQQGYDNGTYGYAIYDGYVTDGPPPPVTVLEKINPDKDKPKITAAIYKNLLKIENNVTEDEDHQLEEQRRLGNCVE